jgi:hypothetical protein
VSVVIDLMTTLKSHPVAIAIGIPICAFAARVIGRLALYAFMVALIVGVGAVWVEEFLTWMG